MTPFFICGLPRSRTTWLAAFFNTAVSRCYHDLGGHAGSVEQIARMMSPRARTVGLAAIGSACSGQVMLFDRLLPLIPRNPRPKFIYVQRGFEEALNSFSRVTHLPITPCVEVFLRCEKALKASITGNPGISVDFDDLDKEETMRAIWHHVLPDHEFPYDRWVRIRDVNIQPDPAQLRADMAATSSLL